MTEIISFELAKLLKEKGFNKYGYLQDVWLGNKYEWKGKGKNKKCIEVPILGLGSSSVLPSIADVIDWLYEKHGIWIWVEKNTDNFTGWIKTEIPYTVSDTKSPTKAYEAAIKYCLKEII